MPSMSFYVAILTHYLPRAYYSDDAAEREGIMLLRDILIEIRSLVTSNFRLLGEGKQDWWEVF